MVVVYSTDQTFFLSPIHVALLTIVRGCGQVVSVFAFYSNNRSSKLIFYKIV